MEVVEVATAFVLSSFSYEVIEKTGFFFHLSLSSTVETCFGIRACLNQPTNQPTKHSVSSKSSKHKRATTNRYFRAHVGWFPYKQTSLPLAITSTWCSGFSLFTYSIKAADAVALSLRALSLSLSLAPTSVNDRWMREGAREGERLRNRDLFFSLLPDWPTAAAVVTAATSESWGSRCPLTCRWTLLSSFFSLLFCSSSHPHCFFLSASAALFCCATNYFDFAFCSLFLCFLVSSHHLYFTVHLLLLKTALTDWPSKHWHLWAAHVLIPLWAVKLLASHR